MRTALLPGLWPRTRALFGGGFPHLAFLIANLFDMLRLLPPMHDYLKPGYIKAHHIGLLDVLRAGAAELDIEWRNIDKIIAFLCVLAGLVMLVIQFTLMVIALIVAPANAQTMPTTYGGFFTTPYPQDDIAFRLIDMVFGIPGLFGLTSGSSQPFHQALQALLQFYSYGVLLIGLFLLIYIVIVIVAETAQTGIPFGKRFNHAWAPMRLVLFLGLLIPISHGLNGAQYIIFLSAKAGSGLATNGWTIFSNRITDTYLGEAKTLIPTPQAPDLSSIPAFITLTKACMMANGHMLQKDVAPWIIVNGKAERYGNKTFQDLTAEAKGKPIILRIGEKDPTYTNFPGNVAPTCGEMYFYTSDMAEPGAAEMQTAYYDLIGYLWDGIPRNQPPSRGPPDSITKMRSIGSDIKILAQYYYNVHINGLTNQTKPPDFRTIWGLQIQHHMTGESYTHNGYEYKADSSGGVIGKAVQRQIDEGELSLTSEECKGAEGQEKPAKCNETSDLLKKGWAGAAIWYNNIAQQNGALITSVQQHPVPSLYPQIMMNIAEQKASKEFFVTDLNRFSLTVPDGTPPIKIDSREVPVARMLNDIYIFWQSAPTRTDAKAASREPTENIFVDAINLLFGTQGLFDMCRNADIHPLAQITALGKGLLDSSVRSFATSAIIGVGSSALSLISANLGAAGYAVAGIMMTVAGLGLMLGFILFYVVPFLPFMYFFFAAGSWLKGLFEAIIGAPLWALGHLRIDGEGIVGEAARDGYFMALEIFLRPILTVFGLLASLIFFAAMVKVLNQIFGEVLANLPAGNGDTSTCFSSASGDDAIKRGPIDELFYTIVYAIIVYLIGMSCFKLIDSIPNTIFRWMGEEINAFGDQAGDAAEGLIQRIAIGGAGMGAQLEGGLGKVTGNLQGGFKSLASTFTQK